MIEPRMKEEGMDYKTLKVETRDQVIWLTLNRPERLNAISHELLMEMIDFFQKMRDDNKTPI